MVWVVGEAYLPASFSTSLAPRPISHSPWTVHSCPSLWYSQGSASGVYPQEDPAFVVALSLPRGTAADPAECVAAGGRSGAWKEEVGCKGRKPDHSGSAAHTPSLTSEVCPASAPPAAAGFQVPEIPAQAPAEFLSAAASPLQKLLPDAADASPTRNENANMAPQMRRSYNHSLNLPRLDPTWGPDPQTERGTLPTLGKTRGLKKSKGHNKLFQCEAFWRKEAQI